MPAPSPVTQKVFMRTVFSLTVLLLLTEQPVQGRANGLSLPPVSSKDLIVTSDSKAYCQRLNATLTDHIRRPHSVPVNTMDDARTLQTQGEALCTHMHVRAGIKRLRRAIILLKRYGEPQK